MRLIPPIMTGLALLAAVPAAAYSTRYEVRHYPAAFTRTVNQVIGTATENYTDGSVAFDFGTTPSPSLSVSAREGGTTAFDIDASYEFGVAVTPTTAAAQAEFVALGRHAAHVKIGEATGVITLSAPAAVGTALSAIVAQPNGTGFSVSCTGGVRCGKTHYHTALFFDALANDPYACTAACPPVPPGTPITLQYSMIAHVQVYGGPGSQASLLIDPAITLDPDFLRTSGLTSRDFVVTPEVGFGNAGATGAVPEPADWAFLTIGFATIGIACRRRPVVAA